MKFLMFYGTVQTLFRQYDHRHIILFKLYYMPMGMAMHFWLTLQILHFSSQITKDLERSLR